MSVKNTILEQSVNMYSLDDNDIQYWNDWAKRLIECCQNHLGWEVTQGPGTSLGNIIPGAYENMGYNYCYYNFLTSGSYDCDWTKTNGIVDKWKNTTLTVDNVEYPLYKGWFYGIEPWPVGANQYGIDDNIGRFDIVIYTATSESGEKIGFRIKYPVCSVGYSTNYSSIDSLNTFYTMPIITLYSSEKGNVEYFGGDLVPPAMISRGEAPYPKFFNVLYDKYVVPFGSKEYFAIVPRQTIYYTSKTDINNTGAGSTEPIDGFKWTKQFQNSLEYNKSFIAGGGVYSGQAVDSMDANIDKRFNNYWKRYNKMYYHLSSSKDTSYFYIADASSKIGFKIITTSLENGEKIIFIDGNWSNAITTNSNILFNTGLSTTSSHLQSSNLKLIKQPTRPYFQINSGIGKFTFSRALLPNQNALCTDLYYVTKKDSNEAIGNGAYVMVKDKELNNKFFRVIPFGSFYTYDRPSQDVNLSYFAFPISDPESENTEVII